MWELLSGAVLLGAAALGGADDKKGGDLKLEGGYTIVSGEKNGQPICRDCAA